MFKWFLACNVKDENKHFAMGAKLYCAPPMWGDGYENVLVVGFHRVKKRYVALIFPMKKVENLRKTKVYKESVLSKFLKFEGYRDWDESKIDDFLRG